MTSMTMGSHDLVMRDPYTGDEVARCIGPDADGRCPRVEVGEVLPCAGCLLLPRGAALSAGYPVDVHMTLCPVTLALAMAVTPDTPLLAG
jgi:hypothetical protein